VGIVSYCSLSVPSEHARLNAHIACRSYQNLGSESRFCWANIRVKWVQL
jgi:hypothetical protein